jgi:hypothetical protein
MSNYLRKEKGFRSTKQSRPDINYENLHQRKPTPDDSENSTKTNHIIKYNAVIRANRSPTFQHAEVNGTKDQHSATTLEKRNNI